MKFKKMSVKNFMSVGNTPVDIDEETTKVHVKELNEYLTEYLDVYYKDLSEKDVVKKSVDELFKQAQDIRTKGENS